MTGIREVHVVAIRYRVLSELSSAGHVMNVMSPDRLPISLQGT